MRDLGTAKPFTNEERELLAKELRSRGHRVGAFTSSMNEALCVFECPVCSQDRVYRYLLRRISEGKGVV